jgi:hypothetical protein
MDPPSSAKGLLSFQLPTMRSIERYGSKKSRKVL